MALGYPPYLLILLSFVYMTGQMASHFTFLNATDKCCIETRLYLFVTSNEFDAEIKRTQKQYPLIKIFF